MMTFTDSLDPNQDRQNVGPDRDEKLFDTADITERMF